MRAEALFAAAALSCAASMGAAADAPVIKIGALFAVTGPASFLGALEQRTAEMLVEQLNAKGGVAGRKLVLIVKDTQGSPEKAISFAKQLIEEDQVFAIIGPSTGGETMKIKGLCEESRTLLISCAAAEDIVKPLARYVFMFPILAQRRGQLAGTLSGGEQQMVAIARALVADPKLIMLDEPSLGLAPLVARAIIEALVALRQEGTTILLVEQNSKAALGIADRGYVMETGSVLLEGSAAELMGNHDVQRAYLGKDYTRIDE